MCADFGAREVGIPRDPISRPGFTALHSLAYWVHHPQTRDELESFIFLIKKGISVHAVDDEGQTVSMVANSINPSKWYPSKWYGSYRGDLWDAALAACGYDLKEFRKDYPRVVAHHFRRYDRGDFETLWQGMGHLFPYWDDRRWPETGVNSDYRARPLLGGLSSPEPDDEAYPGNESSDSQERCAEESDLHEEDDSCSFEAGADLLLPTIE